MAYRDAPTAYFIVRHAETGKIPVFVVMAISCKREARRAIMPLYGGLA